jgi:hypothetical protein
MSARETSESGPRPRLAARKRALFAGAALAGGTLLALALAEGALRLAGIGSAERGRPWFAGGNHPRHLVEAAPASGYRLRAGFRGEIVARTGEFRHPVAIDARGNRAHGRFAPSREHVLAVGDSLTFGEGVPVDAAFPALLERRLGLRVVNAGVPGYRSSQMAARARDLAAARRPELVLVTFDGAWDMDRCRNPFVQHEGFLVASSYRDRLHLIDGNLYAEETRLPALGPLTARLEGHSHLARLVLPALFHALRGGPEPAAVRVPSEWEACVEALVSLQRDLDEAEIETLIVLAGGDHERGRRLDPIAERRLRDAGLDVLSLRETLARAGDDVRYPRDRHWTARGHEVAAGALEPAIRRRLESSAALRASGSSAARRRQSSADAVRPTSR